jgi:hypothetical protein
MHRPPPQIDSARVIAYADVENLEYRKAGALYVGDTLLEKVPRLAIGVSLGEDVDPMLLHCDEQWNCLGTSGASSVEGVKSLAERNYPGVSSRWTESGYTVEQAIAHYDVQSEGLRCSFCGRRSYEMGRSLIKGRNATICYDCVERFQAELREE